MRALRLFLPILILALALLVGPNRVAIANDEEKPVHRIYVKAPPAPQSQSDELVESKTAGCVSCHVKSDAPTMHMTPDFGQFAAATPITRRTFGIEASVNF